eukprot:4243043-Alexandrium_andersonii.AAC.1
MPSSDCGFGRMSETGTGLCLYRQAGNLHLARLGQSISIDLSSRCEWQCTSLQQLCCRAKACRKALL